MIQSTISYLLFFLSTKKQTGLTVIAAVLLATTIFLFFLFIWMLVRSRYRKTYIRNSLKKKTQKDSMDKEKKRRQERDGESSNKAINGDDTEDENAALIV